jgi:hypothetical protein
MLQRPLLFLAVLVTAAGVPYLLLDPHLGQAVARQWQKWRQPAHSPPQRTTELPAEAALRTPAAGEPNSAVPLEEAFRFDLSPQWVISRWPRITTVAGDPEHLGMRVAYVSGTAPDDVAGSLTYFFDRHHQLTRITFTGLTGDPKRLLASTATRYGLKSQPTTAAAHFVAGDPQKPSSEVVARFLPVLTGQPQRQRYEVRVDLRRSDALTWQAKAQLQDDPKLLPPGFRRW